MLYSFANRSITSGLWKNFENVHWKRFQSQQQKGSIQTLVCLHLTHRNSNTNTLCWLYWQSICTQKIYRKCISKSKPTMTEKWLLKCTFNEIYTSIDKLMLKTKSWFISNSAHMCEKIVLLINILNKLK